MSRFDDYFGNLDKKQKDAFERLSGHEQSEYISAINNEPAITNDINRIVENNGAHLEGLDYRIKSPSSLAEKIYDRSDPGNIDNMHDLVRYTEVQSGDKLADSANNTMSEMAQNGYTINGVKNTWDDTENPYKGINVKATAPNGQKLEIQFHTPESFALKNSEEMHGLYEQQRTLDPESDQYFEINDQMLDLSADLQRPDNIDSVANFKPEENGESWNPYINQNNGRIDPIECDNLRGPPLQENDKSYGDNRTDGGDFHHRGDSQDNTKVDKQAGEVLPAQNSNEIVENNTGSKVALDSKTNENVPDNWQDGENQQHKDDMHASGSKNQQDIGNEQLSNSGQQHQLRGNSPQQDSGNQQPRDNDQQNQPQSNNSQQDGGSQQPNNNGQQSQAQENSLQQDIGNQNLRDNDQQNQAQGNSPQQDAGNQQLRDNDQQNQPQSSNPQQDGGSQQPNNNGQQSQAQGNRPQQDAGNQQLRDNDQQNQPQSNNPQQDGGSQQPNNNGQQSQAQGNRPQQDAGSQQQSFSGQQTEPQGNNPKQDAGAQLSSDSVQQNQSHSNSSQSESGNQQPSSNPSKDNGNQEIGNNGQHSQPQSTIPQQDTGSPQPSISSQQGDDNKSNQQPEAKSSEGHQSTQGQNEGQSQQGSDSGKSGSEGMSTTAANTGNSGSGTEKGASAGMATTNSGDSGSNSRSSSEGMSANNANNQESSAQSDSLGKSKNNGQSM